MKDDGSERSAWTALDLASRRGALYGMPITYLIASFGWIVGYMLGAADWAEPAAAALVEYLRSA